MGMPSLRLCTAAAAALLAHQPSSIVYNQGDRMVSRSVIVVGEADVRKKGRTAPTC